MGRGGAHALPFGLAPVPCRGTAFARELKAAQRGTGGDTCARQGALSGPRPGPGSRPGRVTPSAVRGAGSQSSFSAQPPGLPAPSAREAASSRKGTNHPVCSSIIILLPRKRGHTTGFQGVCEINVQAPKTALPSRPPRRCRAAQPAARVLSRHTAEAPGAQRQGRRSTSSGRCQLGALPGAVRQGGRLESPAGCAAGGAGPGGDSSWTTQPRAGDGELGTANPGGSHAVQHPRAQAEGGQPGAGLQSPGRLDLRGQQGLLLKAAGDIASHQKFEGSNKYKPPARCLAWPSSLLNHLPSPALSGSVRALPWGCGLSYHHTDEGEVLGCCHVAEMAGCRQPQGGRRKEEGRAGRAGAAGLRQAEGVALGPRLQMACRVRGYEAGHR